MVDADGFDDMLVLSNAHATEGTGAWTDYFLLTRFVPNSVLYVLNADKNYCRNYECDRTYNYPAILRGLGSSQPD